MFSNKAKRNIWLALAILSIACVIDRLLRVIDGSLEWWDLAAAIVMTILCIRFYLCYRKQAKADSTSDTDNNPQ